MLTVESTDSMTYYTDSMTYYVHTASSFSCIWGSLMQARPKLKASHKSPGTELSDKYVFWCSYPDLPTHTQTLSAQLFQKAESGYEHKTTYSDEQSEDHPQSNLSSSALKESGGILRIWSELF